MKRLVNVRISLFCALATIFGIISFHEVLFGNFVPLIIFSLLALTGLVVFACLKHKLWIWFLICLVFIFAGFFNGFRTYYTRGENVVSRESGVLRGRVTDIGRNGFDNNVLYLENCQLDGKKLDGRVKTIVVSGSEYQTGDVISCLATVQRVYAVKDKIDTASIRNNVRHEASDIRYVEVESGSLTLAETIRKYVYDVFCQYMPQNSDVAYALLTGDRNALAEDKLESFSSAGIIHLLVVSGLHVGFIVAVLGFVLRKLRLPTLVQLAILLIPLGFYAYICSFAPSIMRAVIMSVCVYLTRALFGKYDLLTSLSWAVLLILLWQPLYLFDVGFQLSVMSVYGIATLYLQLDRAMRRRKINKFLRKPLSTLSLSFSCVAATVFVNAYYFGTVALVGVMVNLVAIPLVFVSFLLCVAALFPWWFHYLARGADYVLECVVKLAAAIEKLNLTLPVQAVVLGIAVSAVLLFVLGGYVNLRKVSKTVACGLCAALLVLSVCATLVTRNCQNAVRVFAGYNDNLIVATSDRNEAAIVGSFCDSYVCAEAAEYLQKFSVETVTLYFVDYNAADAEAVVALCGNLSVEKAYLLNNTYNTQLQAYFESRGTSMIYAYPNESLGNSISVQPVFDGGLTAVVVRIGSLCVADVVSEAGKAEQFASLRLGIDYAVVSGSDEVFWQYEIPTISLYQKNSSLNFGANKYGNFTIYEKDGTIKLNFRRY